MRKADVYMHGVFAGILAEVDETSPHPRDCSFTYADGYTGPPISLTMPVQEEPYQYRGFPAFFDAYLPEGPRLEHFLRQAKIDRLDYFKQLLAVGSNLVGAVTVFDARPRPNQ